MRWLYAGSPAFVRLTGMRLRFVAAKKSEEEEAKPNAQDL